MNKTTKTASNVAAFTTCVAVGYYAHGAYQDWKRAFKANRALKRDIKMISKNES